MALKIFEDLRAKSEPPESLREHIEDVLLRVVQLREAVESLSPHTEFSLFNDQNERDEFFKALTKAVILHDFGKIDYGFQKRVFKPEEFEGIKRLLKPLKNVLFARHEVLSAIWASLLLEDSNKWSPKIITAILFHHYNNYFDALKEFPELIYDNAEKIIPYFEFVNNNPEIFKDSYDRLLEYLLTHIDYNKSFVKEAISELQSANWSGFKEAISKLKGGYEVDDLSAFTFFYKVPNTLGKEISTYDEELLEFLLLLGSLRRADYSASGDIAIERGLNELPDFDKAAEIITKKLGENVNLWQKDILKDRETNKLKRMILIAPTGSGKTEFSILWSSKFPKKFLYTLPVRVALNDLYIRFKGVKTSYVGKGYFSKEMGFSEDMADILHSTSFIEYIKEEGGGHTDIESKVNSAKLLSSPVLLTTPDQIFLTSLNYYGCDKVMAIYPMANVVIDEIQTYNPEMAAIIIRTLQLVKSYGGNVLVMTATFPPYFKKFLADFNEIDVSKISGLEIKNLKLKRHKIEVIEDLMFEYKVGKGGGSGQEIEIKSQEIEIKSFDKIKKWIEEHPRTLIVVNNVKKAIKLYEELKKDPELSFKVCEDDEEDSELFLLHARIVEKYKYERIKAIKERLRNNQKIVVVTTQLIEASVDFDFDSMITEISTIDSQIQRWGRVYRRRKKDYDGEKANILIFVGDEKESKVEFDRGTSYIYDEDVLMATRSVLLKNRNQLLDYNKEKEMVEKTFEIEIGGRNLKEKYEGEIEKNLEFLNYFTASKKSDAQRIFRKLAGINVVVPTLMEENQEHWVKEFARIVKKTEDLTWNEISERIEEKTGEKKNKWDFKMKLYEYSVSFPLYYIRKYWKYLDEEFKGFRIFRLGNEEHKKLKEFGLDKILTDLEDKEIEDSFI